MATDTLRLAGPEGKDAIPFEAVFLVHCTVINDGAAFVLLSPGNQNRTYSTSKSEEIVVPMSLVPGDAFELRLAAGATNASPCCVSGGLAGADISVDVGFRGLPYGYWIAACSGYAAPVPASATSWGSVKALYR